MEKLIKITFKICIAIILIIGAVLGISYANYKTNGKYKRLANIDFLNKKITNPKIINITEIFTPSEKQRTETKYIIIHHDAINNHIFNHVPLFEIEEHHKKKGYQYFAYHYYISVSGNVYQIHNDNEKTNHAEVVNSISVAVCLQGDFNIEKPSRKQYNSLIKTLIYLKKKYPKAGIFKHRDVASKKRPTDCPGTNINLEEIRNTVNNFHYFKLLKNGN